MYEDNIWLGVDEEKQSITRSAVQNEWLVSYHGTARNNCKSIAEDEYRLCKDKVSKEETGVGEYWISPVIAIIEIVLHKS
ncbi:unnamed protein product [Rhizophagus irregularis]|nr:unnamed protein product [Rhizophagus irregularis]